MSSDPVLRVSGVGKEYRVAHKDDTPDSLVEAFTQRLRKPRGNPKEAFWALRDIDLEVEVGDVVGLIGRNGAGKSTLLKLLTRITEPTTGRIDIRGRVGSLLEVGTGFHPELTGRENVFLNGSILGMSTREVTQHFDEIVEFSGVSRFLDTPVKRYSSGMYVRLAFAVAAHLRTDLLFVDEVLAVGDAEFQEKCLGTMRAAAEGGRTVIFVSHQITSVAALCTRAVFLEHGRIVYDGSTPAAIERYAASYAKPGDQQTQERREGTGEVRTRSVTPVSPTFTSGEDKVFTLKLDFTREIEDRFYISAHLFSEHNACITQCDSRVRGLWLDSHSHPEVTLNVGGLWLQPGRYRLDVTLGRLGPLVDVHTAACYFDVLPILPYAVAADPNATESGMVLSDFSYSAP